ncbi:hypothetical protein [Serratia fonticola]|uniref:hypothetical protein n=1 Tax=Serratia fonticola TaxID=47917 RepID=UPI000E0F4A93|nr:hypothetical protein [Serratia fonticola]RDL15925.1 hypothetical protein DFO62_12220 [Serratia fonticola]
MSTRVIKVHPNKIFTGVVESESMISIYTQLHSEVNLSPNDLLSLIIEVEQAKALHDSLGEWLSMKDKK